jgi:hypothetical protein
VVAPPLKDMPDAPLAAIDVLSIDAIPLAYPFGKIAFDRLHQDTW